MFVDEVKIFARAGHGGRGCVAFLRETFRPKGGPCGGNGGRGGDVILEADHDRNNLIDQFYQPRLIAANGGHGLGKGMDGPAGRDLVVKVPCGTLVWELARRRGPATPPPEDSAGEQGPGSLPASSQGRLRLPLATGERPAKKVCPKPNPAPVAAVEAGRRLIADLTQPGQRFVLCKGGRGGLGNRNFATARRQAPRFAQPGEPGEEGEFLLELRLMADVGLVGFPNAGKSTLLAAVSKARPKIAPYPFTTLHPQVGIIEYPDWFRLTVCDVPGLVAGAHRNVGLGHAFLRHIRRCAVLVVLLDMAGTDNRLPWEDYHQLLTELELYDATLLERPRLVVANKMDEPTAPGLLRRFRRRVPGVAVLPVAAAFEQGIEAFKQKVRGAVETVRASVASAAVPIP